MNQKIIIIQSRKIMYKFDMIEIKLKEVKKKRKILIKKNLRQI